MFRIILIMGCGLLTGWLLRRRNLRLLGTLISALIWLLLFLLGVEAGSDDRIVNGMASIGGRAAVISMAGVAGCCLLSSLLWRFSGSHSKQMNNVGKNTTKHLSVWRQMKGSLVIVSFFIAGSILGYFDVIRIDAFDFDLSFYALAALMFCVGVSVGSDLSVFSSLKNQRFAILLLPMVTILGTLAGCLIVTPVLPSESATDVLAVGSGFGYYSLSSIFITEYRGAELGTIALMANIMREIVTLLFSPFLMRWFGPLAPISAGGATSMDTTLPIITTCSGKEFMPVSIYHGFVVDFSVPFLVTFFCTL